MNFRTTIGLVIVLGLVIAVGVAYTASRSSDPSEPLGVQREWFYQVEEDDIFEVVVLHLGQRSSFVTDSEGAWHFDSPDGLPVNQARWGGVTTLLSGPLYNRVITEAATDLGLYGLNPPPTSITVGLEAAGAVEIRLGDKTPDGENHYVQYLPPSALEGQAARPEAVYLVDSRWGDVLIRLTTDRPFITATPGPPDFEGPIPGIPGT